MADQGGGQDEAGLPLKDTLGPIERRVYDNTVNLLSPDSAHAGLAALTRHTKDNDVKKLIATPNQELPKVGPDTRGDYRAIVEAVKRRGDESATKTYSKRTEEIAENGTLPYLDIVGNIPADAFYPVSGINGLFELNTEENRRKGFNGAHLEFAHALHVVAEAQRREQQHPNTQPDDPAFRYGTEIAITALGQYLPAVDSVFVQRGMEPFSKNAYRERSGEWGDSVWEDIKHTFSQLPNGRGILESYIMEAAAGKRVAALAPKPEVASSPTEVSNTGENPFQRAARLRREEQEQKRLAQARADLDNPFDGVK